MYLDPTVFQHGGVWYMFTAGNIELFYSLPADSELPRACNHLPCLLALPFRHFLWLLVRGSLSASPRSNAVCASASACVVLRSVDRELEPAVLLDHVAAAAAGVAGASECSCCDELGSAIAAAAPRVLLAAFRATDCLLRLRLLPSSPPSWMMPNCRL